MNQALTDMLTSAELEAAYLERGAWDDVRLIDRVALHAAARPAAPAIVDERSDGAVTYGQLDHDARRVAHLLLDAGLQPGEIVALQLPNWYASAAVAVGAMHAGAIVNPMLPIYRERELRHMLGLGGTRFIFTPRGVYRDVDYAAQVGRLRADLPALEHHFTVTPELDDLPGLPARAPAGRLPGVPARDVCELMFTSGTEAAPKAIMHTERTLNANSRATWDALGMTGADAVWMPAPIGHSTGFNHGLRFALYHGLCIVLQDRWDPVLGAQLVERHRSTHTLLSTTFLRDLTRAARAGEGDVSSLRLFGCGGAPIPRAAVVEAAEVGINCLRLYGATEFLVAAWNPPGAPEALRLATDGAPLPGVEIEARDESGRAVAGEQGELFVRSPSSSVGFLRDPERTRTTFVDGWVRSGDVGVIDEHGHVSITGRRKEIIIRGGLNISPREVEDAIAQIPGVRAVAVVPLPDERLGETACACVVLDPGTELGYQGMVDHLRAVGVAIFKWPERLEVVEAMPTTATGKIKKHELVARLTGRAVG